MSKQDRLKRWILKEARRRGLQVIKSKRFINPGKRVVGSIKYSRWQNWANNRLYEIQTGKKL